MGPAKGGRVIETLGEVFEWFTTWDTWTNSIDPRTGVPQIGILTRTWEHVLVSAVALGLAVLVAFPLGAWLGHTRRGGLLAISVVNIGRAIPSFGLIAIALPLTIRLARNVSWIDSGLGFLPTAVALWALALPPIFTNTYTGIRSVDPEIVESARGMGVTGPRILWGVEMPLASQVILAGLRTSAVQVVATAPLGALVAYGGLGRFIIDGLAIRDDAQIIGGAILVALLSIATELAFSALERVVVPKPLQHRGSKGPAPVAT
jgi:osmoprotectant transport system permease protein